MINGTETNDAVYQAAEECGISEQCGDQVKVQKTDQPPVESSDQ
jgi:hypothetical protein